MFQSVCASQMNGSPVKCSYCQEHGITLYQTSRQLLSHVMGNALGHKDTHIHIYILTKTPRPGMLQLPMFLVRSVMHLAELKSL